MLGWSLQIGGLKLEINDVSKHGDIWLPPDSQSQRLVHFVTHNHAIHRLMSFCDVLSNPFDVAENLSDRCIAGLSSFEFDHDESIGVLIDGQEIDTPCTSRELSSI